jgi:hypothetical protein
MKPAAIWSFVAGDSKRAPLAVLAAVVLALGLERFAPQAGPWIGVAFVAVLVAGLVAAVFE